MRLEKPLERDLRRLRDLLVRGLAFELRSELALGSRRLPLEVGDVHRDPDRARAVLHAALHRLPDPPGGIRRELEATPPVELLHGADEPDHAFLDEVEKRQAVSLVPLGDRHDEPEVRVDHALLRLEVSALDPLRELDLLLGGQERVAADLVEEELEAVGGRGGERAVRVVGLTRALALAVVETSMSRRSSSSYSCPTVSSSSSRRSIVDSSSERLRQPSRSPWSTSATTSAGSSSPARSPSMPSTITSAAPAKQRSFAAQCARVHNRPESNCGGTCVEVGYAISSEEHRPLDLVATRSAEQAGFTFALASDHFHPWTDKQGQSPFVWKRPRRRRHGDRNASRRHGSHVPVASGPHPASIAQAAATAASMLPGRFFLGVGTGEALNEHVHGDRWPPAFVPSGDARGSCAGTPRAVDGRAPRATRASTTGSRTRGSTRFHRSRSRSTSPPAARRRQRSPAGSATV